MSATVPLYQRRSSSKNAAHDVPGGHDRRIAWARHNQRAAGVGRRADARSAGAHLVEQTRRHEELGCVRAVVVHDECGQRALSRRRNGQLIQSGRAADGSRSAVMRELGWALCSAAYLATGWSVMRQPTSTVLSEPERRKYSMPATVHSSAATLGGVVSACPASTCPTICKNRACASGRYTT